MGRARNERFTIYDAMDKAGYFDSNPANLDARDKENLPLYKGPVQYPKMLYHPQGEQRIVVPGEWQDTITGPKLRDQQSELIWALAHSEAEEAKLRRDGWHDSPAKANAVREGKEVPLTAGETIAAQQAEIKRLQEAIELAKAAGPAAAAKPAAAKPAAAAS